MPPLTPYCSVLLRHAYDEPALWLDSFADYPNTRMCTKPRITAYVTVTMHQIPEPFLEVYHADISRPGL